MRLFTKVFLLLLCTLLVTAALSQWLGEKWRTENKLIEARLAQMSDLAETAVRLYEDMGARHYQQSIHQELRQLHAFGMLTDREGRPVHRIGRPGEPPRPVPEFMHPLIEQARHQQQPVTMIEPPRLSIAIQIQGDRGEYIWAATTLLSPEEMRQTGSSMRLLQLFTALLTIAAVSALLTRMLTRPIRSLQATSERLGHGELSARVEAAVSERNDELGDLAQTIDQMADRLDQLINSHKQLLRDISHELRSPLARLQVALELARNTAGEQAETELDRIGLEADRLNDLIGEVLTLARFDQGGVHAALARIDLAQMIRDISCDATFEAEATGRRIETGELPECHFMADRIWLKRALENVIRNAIRHTPVDSSVEISLNVESAVASIHIRDHGHGVEEEKLAHLFEPFFRASAAREHDNSGYGLGLAIARRAIELHAGTITAGNHADGGLQVDITLPLVSV
ncbi:HAMP domain-containing protein [Mariprofundus erugo]|uniref:sensor histidine kinase n=1 Tax=Mariprofundus erugo TaxID=2528639 RepID=UPI0010FDD203|nr:ATP-binding protein [Mariprofundus erugo]TLS73579.1 HAMP domain-containing protein [Mariprofundus erugo]